jgi:hypothetical protein
MNPRTPTPSLRRTSPLVLLVVGVLIGALLTAVGRQPEPAEQVATGTTPGRPGTATTVVGPTGEVVLDADGAHVPGVDAGGDGAAATGADPATGDPGAPSGPGGEGGAGPAHAAGACDATQEPGVQGVNDTTLKVGFAVPDLGVLAALIEVGDIQEYTRSLIAALEAEGHFPVCGRTVEPVFRTYNVLDPAESRSACVGFADQDKVFAVMALFAFTAADCVAREKGLFMFDAGQALTEPMYAATPLLFAAQPPIERQLRAYSSWVVQDGIAPGKKTGLYYVRNGPGGTAPPGEAIEGNLIAELERLGHPIDVVVATDGCGAYACPDPNDNLALQRFQSQGVEVVYMMNYKSTIIQRAEAQGYRPQWVLLGTAMASDATTGEVPPQNFDGALGLLFEHVGEELAGIPPSAEEEQCFARWESQGGARPEQRDSAVGQSLRQVCDQIELLARALTGAGANLTPQAMVAGMESVRDAKMAYQATLSFVPGKHWGSSENLVVRWYAECECWRSTGGFRPLFGR